MKIFKIKIPFPLLVLVVFILAFGVQIPWLGYYLDDWIMLNVYHLGGLPQLWNYVYLDNRPMVYWILATGFSLLGTMAIKWQIWTLFWRCVATIGLWLSCKRLFPKNSVETTAIALIMAIYPIFLQQPTAIAYSVHWICLSAYAYSLYFMILSIQIKKYTYPFLGIALLLSGFQLFSQEYYVGLELFRPFIIFYLVSNSIPLKHRLLQVVRNWLPYFLLFICYLIWRFTLMPTAGTDRNLPYMLSDLLKTPLTTFPVLLKITIQDIFESILFTWNKTFNLKTLTISPLYFGLSWCVAIITSAICYIYLLLGNLQNRPSEENNWYKIGLPLGLAGVILGLSPGWAIGRYLSDPTGVYNDRFGLAAMFGASILVVAILKMLLRTKTQFLIVSCILIGLGAGYQFRNSTSYRWSWEKQRDFVWQLKWRAPGLESPSAIYGNGALFQYMGSFANISAINLMYSPLNMGEFVDYWYFDLYRKSVTSAIEKYDEIDTQNKMMKYSANITDGLVVQFNPEKDRCLWVLSSLDENNPYLEPQVKESLSASNFARIQTANGSELYQGIFGTEPAHTWCFYYQKSNLALQTGNWSDVLYYWDSAKENGFTSRNEIEYSPFIEAAAHLHRWDLALDLSKKAYFPAYVMHDYLCTLWNRIFTDMKSDPDIAKAKSRVNDEFTCETIIGK
jgi:hypothetical protein